LKGVSILNIVACYKCVLDDEDIQVQKNNELDFSQAGWKIGTYDLNAVEAGMRVFEEVGGTISVLTAAGAVADDSKMKKAILARGPEQMYAIKAEELSDADSFMVAKTLAAGIRKIGGADLVLCGEGSGDVYSQQVGPMLGRLLGWNTMNAVSAIKVEGNQITVKRSLEDSVEELSLSLPAVLCVTSDINVPRIAGMKDILGAGKKPGTVWSLDEVGESVHNTIETCNLVAPEQAERQLHIAEANDEAIAEFVGFLRKSM